MGVILKSFLAWLLIPVIYFLGYVVGYFGAWAKYKKGY